jgi:hypothetical protein
MAFLSDNILDSGLSYLETYGDDLHICSQEPATYTEATSTYTLGDEQSISIGSPGDRGGGGRKVTVGAISGGDVTGTDTATHYAIVYVSGTELLVTGALSSSQAVTSGNTFDAAEFDIGIPDPS